jgi:hypothetical protein
MRIYCFLVFGYPGETLVVHILHKRMRLVFYFLIRPNKEQLRKMQLLGPWQESNLRPCVNFYSNEWDANEILL